MTSPGRVVLLVIGAGCATDPAGVSPRSQHEVTSPESVASPALPPPRFDPAPARPGGPWPWRDGDRLRVLIKAHGSYQLNRRHQRWDMQLPVVWQVSRRDDGGWRIEQTRAGEWQGAPARPDSTGAAYILGLASAIELDPQGRVEAVVTVPEARAWADSKLRELGHMAHLTNDQLPALLDQLNMKSFWSEAIGHLPGFLARFRDTDYEEIWTSTQRYGVSGANPIEALFRRRQERDACPPPTAAECRRLTVVAQGNSEQLRAAFEKRTGKPAPTEMSRQGSRWVLARQGARTVEEVGFYERQSERVEEAGRLIGQRVVERYQILRLAPLE